jgi:MEDS: MEthanogen/methylotroph, DcmR Sensory domain
MMFVWRRDKLKLFRAIIGVKEGVFNSERTLNGWGEKLNQALANGYDGLRLGGNSFWMEKEDWG